MSETVLLEGRNVCKSFGNLKAVCGVDFALFKGEILGLIGPNGSGKTTFVNVVTNVYRTDGGGWIRFNGRRIDGLPPHATARLGIARTYQVIKPFLNMTVGENIAVGAIFGRAGMHRSMREVESIVEEKIELLNLKATRDTPVDSLNIVDRKRMDLAKALAAQPELLIIDEVMAGLNTKDIDQMIDVILRINGMGVTVLCIEHVMKALMAISRRVMVFHHGQKIGEGCPADIVRDERVIKAYLGTRFSERGKRV